MNRLQAMEVFTRVVEANSFTRADVHAAMSCGDRPLEAGNSVHYLHLG